MLEISLVMALLLMSYGYTVNFYCIIHYLNSILYVIRVYLVGRYYVFHSR